MPASCPFSMLRNLMTVPWGILIYKLPLNHGCLVSPLLLPPRTEMKPGSWVSPSDGVCSGEREIYGLVSALNEPSSPRATVTTASLAAKA